MQLSISNIAWDSNIDIEIYSVLKEYGFCGLEIAPTRIFHTDPYEHINDALIWSRNLLTEYNLKISSMQSIWYGRKEMLFGSMDERKVLLEYTMKAIDFASTINCKNLVFGCPKNRFKPDKASFNIAIEFFKKIGDYAYDKGTVIGLEANPTIYNTNYINTTESAIETIKLVDSKGFKLNLDIGTMIQNDESLNILRENAGLINHVHISEPNLAYIENRQIHKDLIRLLKDNDYNGFISIEMAKRTNISDIKSSMSYLKSLVKKDI